MGVLAAEGGVLFRTECCVPSQWEVVGNAKELLVKQALSSFSPEN